MKRERRRNAFASTISLFTSVGTLLCCALPALLVLLGLGATVASLLSAAPWLVALSRHKPTVFIISGVMIAGNIFYVYWLAPRLQARDQTCDPTDVSSCEVAGRFSRAVLWISAAIYTVGFFAAFLLGPILMRLDK